MGNFEDMKGRAKEATGDLTGDEDMEREGKLDQASASVKEGIDKVKDKIGGILDRDR